jgi:hypothetical protein
LGRDETPFFGVPKKEKRENWREMCAILRGAERWALGFADAASAIDATEAGAGAAEVVNGVVALPTPGVET